MRGSSAPTEHAHQHPPGVQRRQPRCARTGRRAAPRPRYRRARPVPPAPPRRGSGKAGQRRGAAIGVALAHRHQPQAVDAALAPGRDPVPSRPSSRWRQGHRLPPSTPSAGSFGLRELRGNGAALPVGASDGTRTRDIQDHNLALYQLSYTRHTRRSRDLRERARAVNAAVQVGPCREMWQDTSGRRHNCCKTRQTADCTHCRVARFVQTFWIALLSVGRAVVTAPPSGARRQPSRRRRQFMRGTGREEERG